MDLEAVFQTGLLVSARTVLTEYDYRQSGRGLRACHPESVNNGTQSLELSIVNELHSRDVCAKNPFAEE